LPEKFERLYRKTDSAVAFQTYANEEVFKSEYDLARNRLAERLPFVDLKGFDLSFESRPLSMKQGSREFVKWLERLPAEAGVFYSGLSKGKDVRALLEKEFLLSADSQESLYRKYHAAGLLLEAAKAHPEIKLPHDVEKDLGYLRSRASAFFSSLVLVKRQNETGAKRYFGPDAQMREELHANFESLGHRIESIDATALTKGLRDVFARRAGVALVYESSNSVGSRLGEQERPTSEMVQAARRYSVIFTLADGMQDVMAGIPEVFEGLAQNMDLDAADMAFDRGLERVRFDRE
jgi:hypothetical protein